MHDRPGGTSTAYGLAGLRIDSEIALGDDAPPADDASTETIEIRQTHLPRTLSAAAATFPLGQCNRDELLIHLPGLACCLTRNGREILVDPDADADRGELRSHLLGTMFGVLCHQRRILPLHCSAIAADGGTVAFVGGRGTGKSTLVASLLARGHCFVADDVCFLRLDQGRTVQAWPGVRHVLLRDDAMQALNGRRTFLERQSSLRGKHVIAVSPPADANHPRPLKRVYALDTMASGPPRIERLYGSAAVEALLRNVYRLELAELMGLKPAAFAACAAIARSTPVFRFRRPPDFAVWRQGVTVLEGHFSGSG